jgi:hypothetical protein
VIDPMDEERRPSVHTHPLEVVSLAIGTILLALGLVFAVGDVDISRASVGWISFGTLGTIGVLLVAQAVRRHRAGGPQNRSAA